MIQFALCNNFIKVDKEKSKNNTDDLLQISGYTEREYRTYYQHDMSRRTLSKSLSCRCPTEGGHNGITTPDIPETSSLNEWPTHRNSFSDFRRRRQPSYGTQRFRSFVWFSLGVTKCSDNTPNLFYYFYRDGTRCAIHETYGIEKGRSVWVPTTPLLTRVKHLFFWLQLFTSHWTLLLTLTLYKSLNTSLRTGNITRQGTWFSSSIIYLFPFSSRVEGTLRPVQGEETLGVKEEDIYSLYEPTTHFWKLQSHNTPHKCKVTCIRKVLRRFQATKGNR